MEAPMRTFIYWTSRVAIAGRVTEWQRQFRSWDEWVPPGDYHLPCLGEDVPRGTMDEVRRIPGAKVVA